MANPTDPRIQKLLAQLINHPETVNSMDVAPETDESANFAIQEPDSEYEVPAEIKQGVQQVGQASDKMNAGMPNNQYQLPQDIKAGVQQAGKASDQMVAGLGNDKQQYTPDPKIMEMMKRLKAGQPMEDESEQDTEQAIQDPDAPEEVRKAAIQKVRQKYLGK